MIAPPEVIVRAADASMFTLSASAIVTAPPVVVKSALISMMSSLFALYPPFKVIRATSVIAPPRVKVSASPSASSLSTVMIKSPSVTSFKLTVPRVTFPEEVIVKSAALAPEASSVIAPSAMSPSLVPLVKVTKLSPPSSKIPSMLEVIVIAPPR